MKPLNQLQKDLPTGAATEAVAAILKGMVSTDAAPRRVATRLLLQQDASALPALADAAGGTEPASAKAAKAAMERLVHHLLTPPAGKARPDEAVQTRVADTLSQIAESARPRAARACAVSLLGFAGTKRQEKVLERLEKDAQVGEEARMARTRIKSVGY